MKRKKGRAKMEGSRRCHKKGREREEEASIVLCT